MPFDIPASFAEVSPPLASVRPVIEGSQHVRTDTDAIERVASWLAYEEFSRPGIQTSAPLERSRAIDLTMFTSTLNFAFTDFATSQKFEVEGPSGVLSDSEAMFHCVDTALQAGVPLTDGRYQAQVTREQLDEVFRGNIEIPMLDERAAMLNQVGAVLADRYDGSFTNFIDSCPPRLYHDGEGVLERLLVEFPRFDDVSDWHGHRVQLHKLAQLSLWSMHAAGFIHLEDLPRMTAFADYIVPVAMRLFGIFVYSDDLEARINEGQLIPRDSDEEIEIRAHSLHSTALLTEAVNRIRPAHMRLVIPQLDYRLWKTYHATFWPHHLTRTVMY
jgi:hypothetical protein